MQAPRNLDHQASGLAPLSQPGPGQPIAHASVQAQLSDRDRAVVNEGLDYICKAQAHGESAHTLMRLRGLLRRIERKLQQHAAMDAADSAAAETLDIDTTGWGT